MAEPLKNMYNEQFLREFGAIVQAAYSSFNINGFVNASLKENWEALSLMERMRKITITLHSYLPDSYNEAIQILLDVNESCYGFPYLILPDFVEVYGQQPSDWDCSIQALEQFTSHSTAEFAVRPFILRNPVRMMEQMLKWSKSSNEHVRRLASEGCRPRLPWGKALHIFKKDPFPIIKVLEQLKTDESLYVRKSVANNLNDIAKDHPQLVIQLAKSWIGHSHYTDWIVRYGCRTLIRQAHPEILALFGYAMHDTESNMIEYAELTVNKSILAIGEESELTYKIAIRPGEPVRIRVEYCIDFVKSSGKISSKKFLLSDKTVAGGALLVASRTHRWSDLTTRRHYPGKHRIALVVNGVEVAETDVEIVPAITKDK